MKAGKECLGKEESELDSRYAVFPVPSRESKPNGPKGSWTPAGARQRDLVLSMQAEDDALGFLKDDSFTVEQFQETTVMGEKGIGSYWEKVMEDSDDPVSKPTKESRFKLWQVKKKKWTQLATNVYAGFPLIGQPSHLHQLPISSFTPWLSKEC